MYSDWYEYLYYYWWYHQQQVQRDIEMGNYYATGTQGCSYGETSVQESSVPMDIVDSQSESIEVLQEIKQEIYSISEKLTAISYKLRL